MILSGLVPLKGTVQLEAISSELLSPLQDQMRREKALKRREALQNNRRMAAEAAAAEKLALKTDSAATPPPTDGPSGQGAASAPAADHHAAHHCALRLYTPDDRSAGLGTPLAAHHQPPKVDSTLLSPSVPMPAEQQELLRVTDPANARSTAVGSQPVRPLELSASDLKRQFNEPQQHVPSLIVSSLSLSSGVPSRKSFDNSCPTCAANISQVHRFLVPRAYEYIFELTKRSQTRCLWAMWYVKNLKSASR